MRRASAPPGGRSPRNIREASASPIHRRRRADADHCIAQTEFLEPRPPAGASFAGALQADAFAFGKRIQNTGATQHFQIVKTFVRRNFAGEGNRNGAGEQQSPAVARVADSFGNAGGESDCRGFERVLQKHGAVESFATQSNSSAPFLGQRARGVGNYAMAKGFAAIEIGHGGLGENGKLGVRVAFVQCAQRRQGHYRIAQPVGGAHENLAVRHYLLE